jgi:branched-chain amino acid transport system substrate-binding protein
LAAIAVALKGMMAVVGRTAEQQLPCSRTSSPTHGLGHEGLSWEKGGSMHKRRHPLTSAVWVLVLFVAVASTLSGAMAAAAAAAKTPIRMGVLAPLTGPLAALARDIVDGARLYVDEVNGEMVGRKVELIVEDYEFKAAVALTKTKKLVERDRVHVVVGVILSAAALAMKDYIHAQQVPFIISGAAVAEPLMMEKPTPYVFRTTFSASQVPTPLAKFAYDKLKARSAAVIAGDTVGTIELVMAFARAFEEAGGKVVQELYPPIGTTDFGPYIGRLRRDVDVVATLVPGADGIRFITQYEEFGLKGKIQVVDTAPGITDVSLLPSSGPAALGMYASQSYVHTIDTPRNQQFVQAFHAKYGRDPGGPGEATYVALAAIHQALTATGGNIEDKPKFLEALRRMDLEAPRGHVRFDRYQNVITNVFITRIEKAGDQIVPVVVETIPEMDQFLGMAPEDYLKRPRLIALKGTFSK